MPEDETPPDPRWAAVFEELNRQEVTYAAPHDLTAGRIFVDGPIDLAALFAAIDRVPKPNRIEVNVDPLGPGGLTYGGGFMDELFGRRRREQW